MSLSYLRAVLIIDPLILLATAIMGSISAVASFFERDGRRQHAIACRWGWMLTVIAGARVRVIGREKLDPRVAYVLCPNHLSYMDTPVLLTHLPVPFRFLAKSELFAIPFIGGHLARAGHVAVPLEDPRGSVKVLTEAGRKMRENGLSMLVFPEGGRSEDGVLQPFREGAAYLAIKAEAPLVPIAIVGVRNVLPMHSHHVRPGRVTLRIGDPIPTAPLKSHDRLALTDQARQSIIAMLSQGQAGAE
jgi:1-acyl-sn-glycerol-3-phosphate acyltransferase